MKTIKFLFFLIILGLSGLLVYQNLDYFTTVRSFHLDLKFMEIKEFHYTIPELPNWAFWVFCFVLGLMLTGMKGLFTAFRLGREIKAKDVKIRELRDEISDLKIRLDVFIHDPYIKNRLAEEEAAPEESKETPALPAPEEEQPEAPETPETDEAADEEAPEETASEDAADDEATADEKEETEAATADEAAEEQPKDKTPEPAPETAKE